MNRIFGRNTGTANAAFEGEPGTVLEEDSSRKKVTTTDGPVLTKIVSDLFFKLDVLALWKLCRFKEELEKCMNRVLNVNLKYSCSWIQSLD